MRLGPRQAPRSAGRERGFLSAAAARGYADQALALEGAEGPVQRRPLEDLLFRELTQGDRSVVSPELSQERELRGRGAFRGRRVDGHDGAGVCAPTL